MTKKEKTYNGLKIVYSINGVGNIGQICAKNETRLPSYTMYKNKLKWIKDLNVRLETIKTLEESIGSKISGISHSNILPDMCPWAGETKEKINKWDYMKQKSFFKAKETINKVKRQPTE